MTRNPFEFTPATKVVTYQGVDYTFRELTVAENDTCRDLSTDEKDMFDGRVMIRQMIVLGALDPEMTMDDLEKVPQRLYAQFIDVVNELNDPDTFGKDEDPGNSSTPTTSSDTKSPESSDTIPLPFNTSPDPSTESVAPTT